MMNRVELKEEMMEAVVGGGSWGEDLWNGFVDTVMPFTTELYEYYSENSDSDYEYSRWRLK